MTGDPPDRRSNRRVRDRLDAIQAGYERWARRTFRALLVIAATFVATAAGFSYLLHEIQQERAAAIHANCKRDNRQNRAIRGFIRQTTRSPTLDRRARRAFPIRDCDKEVERNVTASP